MDLSKTSNYPISVGYKVRPMKKLSTKLTVLPQFPQRLFDHRRSHCSFIEEVICKVPGSLRIHPSLWSKEDIIHWLRWAEEEYSLDKTDDGKFILNGRALCILTKEDFKSRSPSSGDVLYELLRCIKTHRQGLTSHPDFSQTIRKYNHLHTKTCIAETPKCPTKTKETGVADSILQDAPLNLSQRMPRTQGEQESPIKGGCVDGKIKDCRLLWDYLYQLLDDKRYEPYIKWQDRESKVFRVVDPNKLAALWGNHKNRPNMTYEKMSRAMRQYYKINLLKKEFGQKLTFRFLRSPKERLPSEKLQQLEANDVLDSSEVLDLNEDGFAVSP
ncbi:transcription factor ETV7-like isoform X1 [Rana temporaria]|uniref:transcription factor ETV7-like isoform X1 n=2 Tax=Rana temporaria TaxID=8407 RepID=UPI001AAC4B03|nr:transcription factor ETV7-like isoform X1 [Rana temporaria]